MSGQRYADTQNKFPGDVLAIQEICKLPFQIIIVFFSIRKRAAQPQRIQNIQVQVNQNQGKMILSDVDSYGKAGVGRTAEYAGFSASG